MYIRDKEIQNMTNINTVTNTAFGKTLHYVVDDYYADAIKTLTGKKTINDNDIIALMQLGLTVNNNTLQELIAV
tara:strand:- start:320 stop:541 length:222 start_codon:yes stop_codon:yes gene_type:complete